MSAKIGLEIHVTLALKSKLFCSCRNQAQDEPNTLTCPVCMGHPGAKLALNKEAVAQALAVCQALGCEVADTLVFDRKTYFYPDMSKNYQITQYETPIGANGQIALQAKIIRISRVQIEEDPAAIQYGTHLEEAEYSLIDYNRAGRALLEIVTEPDFTHHEEVEEFFAQFSSMLTYLGVRESHQVMKADVNVSIPETDYSRVEIKNINGSAEIRAAIKHELIRQKLLAKKGKSIAIETRGWDGKKTYSLRSKESEADYGYIREPNVPIITVSAEMNTAAKQRIPEFKAQKVTRYVTEMGITQQDATIIAADPSIAAFFEEVAAHSEASLAAQWIRRELLRVLNYTKKTVETTPITPTHIVELLDLLDTDTITESTAQTIMELLSVEAFEVKKYVDENGLGRVSDDAQLKEWCEQAIAEHTQAVEDYVAGEEKSLHYLVGQVMRMSRGAADAEKVREELKKLIKT